jgi:hypothetical protein
MPRRAPRSTLDCKASAATSAGGSGLDTVRGEHALGLEVAGESSGRRVWPWRAWLGGRSRLRRWLPAGRAAAWPYPGRGRLPGRSRLPGPHQRPAPTGRHAARTAAEPFGPWHAAAAGIPARIASPGAARRGHGQPPVAQGRRPDAVPVGRPPKAAARAGTARRPGPGQRPRPTAGGQSSPCDGGGNHDVERAAGSPQRHPDAPASPAPRRLPQLHRLRPDGSRAARRRRRSPAAQAPQPSGPGRPGQPGGPDGGAGPCLRARGRVVRPGRAGAGPRSGVGGVGGPGSAERRADGRRTSWRRTDATRQRPAQRRLRPVRPRPVRPRPVRPRSARPRPAMGGPARAAALRTGTVGRTTATARAWPGVVRTGTPRRRPGRVRANRVRPGRMGGGSPPCWWAVRPARPGPARPLRLG